MAASLTFHPLGNADSTRIDLASGKKMLVDYADMKNHDDPNDKRCDLPVLLKADLRTSNRDYYDVMCFTHLDDDHCCGSDGFFWLEHALKYQSNERIKIRELWVPAAAILEDGLEDSARVVRQEARHRLKNGKGIRVFSRPEKLKRWLEANGLSLESRAHLITDAGQLVPDFRMYGPDRVEFFIHSPFGWRQNENEGIVDRNEDSIVFQATFLEGQRQTRALFISDINYDTIDQIVQTTKRHKNEVRLLWDIFKIPHHCSYKSIGPVKGDDKTDPTTHVEWLCETQGQPRHIMMSTSKPMPLKGTPEDVDDVQPPHRQAGNYYESVADMAEGEFRVTMDMPNSVSPKPTTIKISDRGAVILSAVSVSGALGIMSTPARAG